VSTPRPLTLAGFEVFLLAPKDTLAAANSVHPL
jgi:hypothetical protein